MSKSGVYKLDRWTGETFYLRGIDEIPVTRKEPSDRAAEEFGSKSWQVPPVQMGALGDLTFELGTRWDNGSVKYRVAIHNAPGLYAYASSKGVSAAKTLLTLHFKDAGGLTIYSVQVTPASTGSSISPDPGHIATSSSQVAQSFASQTSDQPIVQEDFFFLRSAEYLKIAKVDCSIDRDTDSDPY